MGGLEDAGPTAEGVGRLAQETTVGSTLCTGVEEASGVFKHTHRQNEHKDHMLCQS